MSKMGASALLNERMQTRILQAAGRCTRALQDRSAVFVTGHELLDFLADDRNWRHFHPELQAELAFGVYQSKEANASSLMANFKSFIANDADWDEANSDIVDDASNYKEEAYSAMHQLDGAVSHEVRYQKALWGSDYERALAEARAVTAKLKAPELCGYRALWHYLAGSVSQMLSAKPGDGPDKAAREQFAAAKGAAPSVPWLAHLTRADAVGGGSEVDGPSVEVNVQAERLEGKLLGLGTVSDYNFEKRAKAILDALATPKTFEEGQRQLGELLGFVVGNGKGDAAPDPWWLGETIGLVIEDHAGGDTSTVFGATKAKQAALHPDWLKENVPEAGDLELTIALVTPCTSAGKGAKPALKKVRYWPVEEFRLWATDAVNVVRELKTALPPDGDLFWRLNAANKLASSGLTLEALISTLPVASDEMTFV